MMALYPFKRLTMMSFEVSPRASVLPALLLKSLNWVVLLSNLTMCLSRSERVAFMYVAVDLSSMVILDIMISKKIGPSLTVFC